jgi:hypothetical protein
MLIFYAQTNLIMTIFAGFVQNFGFTVKFRLPNEQTVVDPSHGDAHSQPASTHKKRSGCPDANGT